MSGGCKLWYVGINGGESGVDEGGMDMTAV